MDLRVKLNMEGKEEETLY